MVYRHFLLVLVLAVPEQQQELSEPGSPGILSSASVGSPCAGIAVEWRTLEIQLPG